MFDLLWRPVGKHGPIETGTGIRAMTIVEPAQLPELIKGGLSVLLALGPCRRCFKPRSEILRAIIGQPERLISHLVTDSRTVADLLRTSAA